MYLSFFDVVYMFSRFSNYGAEALFICPKEGTYIAYAKDVAPSYNVDRRPPVETGFLNETVLIWYTRAQLSPFQFLQTLVG